ncbi:MAG: PAS-domain containing protein [Rhodoferax sp.]
MAFFFAACLLAAGLAVSASVAYWISGAEHAGADLYRHAPAVLGLGGALISIMLAVAFWLLATWRVHALALAQGMTADLERLGQVVQQTSNAVMVVDANLRITWVNGGFTRIFGYTLEEVVGKKPGELIASANNSQQASLTLRRAVKAGKSCRVELLSRARNGTELWMDLDIQPRHNALGQLTGFMEIGLDITSRKQMEEVLRASKAFLARSEQMSGVGGWEMDLTSRRQTWSDQMYRICDLPSNRQPSTEESLALFAQAEQDTFRRLLQRCIANREPWDVQLPMTTGSGLAVWVRSMGTVEFEGDKPTRVVGTLQDITTLRQREAELAKSNELLHSVLNNLPCGLSVFDADLNLIAYNQQLLQLLDLPQSLFAGRVVTLADVIRFDAARGEFREGEAEYIVKRLTEHARIPIPHHFERRRHTGRPLEIRGAPLPGGGFVTTYMDISERKKNELLKNQFISTVSHELRTPLTSIYGSLSLLASGNGGELPADTFKLISVAHQSSERLVRLINDILDFEKIASGLMNYNLSRQAFRPIIQQAVDATEAYAHQFGVALKFNTPDQETMVNADADRISQVIVNLLSNAIKFSKQGAQVSIKMTTSPTHVRLSVIDQGEGIADAFRTHIFQRFSQSDGSDKRQKGGTGLGLSICKSIVEQHHGRIDYDSVLGRGTEFFFDLPLADIAKA